MSDMVYELKFTLIDTKPAIWRRVAVPADITLAQLHDVIQIAMGWTNSHLHVFTLQTRPRPVPKPRKGAMTMEERIAFAAELRACERRFAPPDWELEAEDEAKAVLGELLPEVNAQLEYTYDMGDDWKHLIEVEAIADAKPGVEYPVCLSGARTAPPEDCGGAFGFYDMLEALADPKHEQHEDMVEWICSFDADAFNLKATNSKLAAWIRPKSTQRARKPAKAWTLKRPRRSG